MTTFFGVELSKEEEFVLTKVIIDIANGQKISNADLLHELIQRVQCYNEIKIATRELQRIRTIKTYFVDGEKFLEYCTEDDFEYPIKLWEKFVIATNSLCVQGRLFEVDVNADTFTIKADSNLITLKCSDVIMCGKLNCDSK